MCLASLCLDLLCFFAVDASRILFVYLRSSHVGIWLQLFLSICGLVLRVFSLVPTYL